MRHSYTANSSQLSELKQVFETYCRDHRIADPSDRETIASHLMSRFAEGALNKDELLAGLPQRAATAAEQGRAGNDSAVSA